jgi:uncharacterized protein (TIGR00106 family)
MSVIMEFAIFPTDKGGSVSSYVKKVVEMIDALPYPSQLTAMGTLVECDTMDQCLAVLSKANIILEADSERIYSTAKFDNKPRKTKQLEHKVAAIRGGE